MGRRGMGGGEGVTNVDTGNTVQKSNITLCKGLELQLYVNMISCCIVPLTYGVYTRKTYI